ncbi:MAG: hypothetical protein ACREA2_14470 [Blastocatellia bacterium]
MTDQEDEELDETFGTLSGATAGIVEELADLQCDRSPISAPRESAYHLNYCAFEADARCAVMMQMLEIAGFPADSQEFAELECQAMALCLT